MARELYDVIVVGAGFGGSSCAGLLAKHGLNVLLVEKNNRAGGKAMSPAKLTVARSTTKGCQRYCHLLISCIPLGHGTS